MSFSGPSLRFIVSTLSCLLLATGSGFAQVYNNPNAGGQSPDKANELYMKAKEAFNYGDFHAAIEILKAAKNFNHADKNIIHLLALAYAEQGNNYDANMWFRSALSLDYNFIEARNNYGIFMHKTGKLKDAKKEFETIITINPNYPDAHYNLGVILKEQGDLDNAIEQFRSAIHLKPNYFAAQRELGMSLYEKYERGELKEISESLDKLQNAAKLIPNNPMVHFYLGKIWCSQGNLDEAEKEFRLALRCDAQLAAGHYELAKLRYLRGDPDRCLSELKTGFKVNPVYTDSKKYPGVNLKNMRELSARCNEFKGNLMIAANDWKEVAEQTHNNQAILKHIQALVKESQRNRKRNKNAPVFDAQQVQALIDTGIQETDEGNFNGAKRTFNRVLELNSDSFEGYQNLGALYEVEGQFDKAMSQYKKAVAIMPDYDGLYYNMAYLLEKMQLPVEAGRIYKKFHDIAGKYPYDPKHIVKLQLEEIRQQRREDSQRNTGF
ncbi:MAG: tetratricopeptide repeat protein [Candidatus Obscuribacterales bacterium]|nr:tetratricopeptide repeat protein [Candidatus Obscuribacterales bacterium]